MTLTLETMEGSWTTTSERNRAPFGELGLLPMVAIPLYTGAVALSAALGMSVFQSFGGSQATFEEGWKEGTVFDARMAAMKQMWLKFDQSIQLRCPSFVKRDNGSWWRQFKADMEEFGKFYASVGTHPGYFSGWSSSVAGAAQIGGAQSRLASLIGWGQAVETSCPGTFPNLGVTLTASQAELAAEQKRIEDAKNEKGFFDSFGSNLGVTLGVSAVGLGVLAYLMRPQIVSVGNRGLSGFSFGPKRSRRRRKSR